MNLKNLIITILSISVLLSATTINAQMRVGLGNLKQVAKTAKTLKNSAGMSKEEVAKELAIEVTPEFKHDHELTMKLSKSFSSGKFASNFENNSTQFRNEVLEELVEFESYETLISSLETKYESYFKAWDVDEQRKALKEGRRTYNNSFFVAIGNVEKYLASFRADVARYESSAPQYAEESMTKAEEIFESALKQNKVKDERGNPLFKDNSLLSKKLQAVQVYLAILDLCKGKNSPAVVTLRNEYNTRTDKIRSRESELMAAKIASIQMKEEIYPNTDKETVRQLIKDQWTKTYGEEVLKIVLLKSDDSAFTGFRDGEWLDYDRKIVNFQIAVNAKDGTHAHIYKGVIKKDNRTGKWQPEKMHCTAKALGYKPTRMLKGNLGK